MQKVNKIARVEEVDTIMRASQVKFMAKVSTARKRGRWRRRQGLEGQKYPIDTRRI